MSVEAVSQIYYTMYERIYNVICWRTTFAVSVGSDVTAGSLAAVTGALTAAVGGTVFYVMYIEVF